MSKTAPKFVKKGWGYELWIANNDRYCGKLLHFEKDKKCSWHYHKVKDEVFYIHSGRLLIRWSDNNGEVENTIILKEGETFHVPPGRRHQMTALETTDMYEISTYHMEEDSIRLEKGD